LDAPRSIHLAVGEQANAVIRCVQEIVTNTIKHAGADNLWITLACKAQRIEITACDDGQGARRLTPGNGLAGMRERVSALGGQLLVETQEGAGFQVRAFVPIAQGLAA
jgi:signal transduction histidine kinase